MRFEVREDEPGAHILQTAIYESEGWGGLLDWYALDPLYAPRFVGMLPGRPGPVVPSGGIVPRPRKSAPQGAAVHPIPLSSPG